MNRPAQNATTPATRISPGTTKPDFRDAKNDKHYCLIEGDYKLIHHQLRPEESEFFDLAGDPGELDNLFGREEPAGMHSAALDSLLRELKLMDIFSPIMPGMTDTDLERSRKLKSLGYVH